MPDTDIIEQEDQELDTQHLQDEPRTELPDKPSGETQDRQSLIDETLSEGVNEAVVEELAAKEGDLTVEDLRRLPGSEDMSDDELKAEWAKAVATAEGQTADTDAEGITAGEFKLPFPIYDAQGNKIEAFEKVSLRDLLEGKLQIGYQAMGKEQRKTLTEAIRNASLGHWNEQKYNLTLQERNQVSQQLAEARNQISSFNSQQKVWDAALTALAMGNIEPMKKLATAYQAALTQLPQQQPGMVSVDQVRQEQLEYERGLQYIQGTIIPASVDIATRYGANPQEVLKAVEWYLQREPPEFLTQEKIQSIIQYEVPALLEANGYTVNDNNRQATGANTAGGNAEVEELKRTVAALQASVADAKNAKTQAVREKAKKAPPAGGGSTPGAGDSMPSFKSRSQMKAWMQGDPDWAKA